MAIGSQTLKVGTFQRHLLKRNQKRKSRKRLLIAGLTLTSMVDMFSLLVIFLLQSFATSPELIISKGVSLPAAITGREILDAPVLALSNEGVYLDQKLIGKLDEVLNDPSELMTKLGGLRELWMKTHPDQKFRGEISLQAHRDLPSTVVSQFMGMLPSQNYGLIQMAVVAKGK